MFHTHSSRSDPAQGTRPQAGHQFADVWGLHPLTLAHTSAHGLSLQLTSLRVRPISALRQHPRKGMHGAEP